MVNMWQYMKWDNFYGLLDWGYKFSSQLLTKLRFEVAVCEFSSKHGCHLRVLVLSFENRTIWSIHLWYGATLGVANIDAWMLLKLPGHIRMKANKASRWSARSWRMDSDSVDIWSDKAIEFTIKALNIYRNIPELTWKGRLYTWDTLSGKKPNAGWCEQRTVNLRALILVLPMMPCNCSLR